MTTIVRNEIKKFVVQTIPNVEKCMLADEKGKTLLKTQGINLPAFYKHAEDVDVNQVYSNDIHIVADTYGIEAAAKLITKVRLDLGPCYALKLLSRFVYSPRFFGHFFNYIRYFKMHYNV